MERAMLLLKSTQILDNHKEDCYRLHPRIINELRSLEDVDRIIARDVTTKEEIEQVFKEAHTPQHAAISLAGEPTLYPRLGELVTEFRKKGMSTFIVTNGTHPEVLQKLKNDHQLPTQLYVSIPAPTKDLYLKICRPMTANTWENILQTFSLLPSLPCRTVIRITAVKYLNISPELAPLYVKIFDLGRPNFIDIKGFTVEGNALEMQNRFHGDHNLREYPPSFQDLLEFAKALEIHGSYEIIRTHEGSRDILLRGTWPKEKPIEINYSDLSSL
jgi:tRNA wybutosine-synthesizing protein 1